LKASSVTFSRKFLFYFWNPGAGWIRVRNGIQPKMLDPDPDKMNADPQPWLNVSAIFSNIQNC
jgi:hypothetical protein